MKKFFASVAAATAIVFSALIPATSATAHDELVSQYPEANSTVEAGTFGISLTFNEDAMQVAGNAGFGIAVTGPDGKAVPVDCLNVSGPNVSALTSLDKEGEYTVDWRSVSNDGHPNSGTFKFTVTNTTSFVAEALNCDAATAILATESPMPLLYTTDTAGKKVASNSSNSGSLAWVGFGIGAGLIVLGSVAGALRTRYKERKAESEPEILSDDK